MPKELNCVTMESLERLNIRITYGRNIDNVSSRVFFSLEPTLRYALINYLQRKHKEEVRGLPLLYMADFELVRLFEELVQPDAITRKQIAELHQAITDYRLITFARRHGNDSSTIKKKSDKLKDTDYYLTVMEDVLNTLLRRVNEDSSPGTKGGHPILANKAC